MKQCTKCKEIKPLAEFYQSKVTKDGLRCYCKNCILAYQQSERGKEINTKAVKKYLRSKQGQKVRKICSQSDKSKATQKRYRESNKVEMAEYRINYNNTIIGKLHNCFRDIKHRCYDNNCKSYKYYGGRGVSCLFDSFNDFFEHVVNDLGYTSIAALKGKQVHRIDNGNYRPGNIEFLSPLDHKAAHRAF